jgi:hypothetical protein
MAAGERSAIRVMVHDDFDALFEELDANADGRLGEREVRTAPARMLACDRNRDGQLTGDELPTTMLAAFMRSERRNERSFYVPDDRPAARPTDDKTAAAAAAWFAQADFNGDGDVSGREFLGSLEQFTQLDSNHDGFISSDEAQAATPKPEPSADKTPALTPDAPQDSPQ